MPQLYELTTHNAPKVRFFASVGRESVVERKAYRKFGAAFTVDTEGTLSLQLSLDLEEVEKSLQEKSIFWAAATR